MNIENDVRVTSVQCTESGRIVQPNKDITFLMVVKNVTHKSRKNFIECITQASKLSKDFLIIDNGSTDNTALIINKLRIDLDLVLDKIYDATKEFDYLKYKYSKMITSKYIFVLDDDEILDDRLIDEINNVSNHGHKLFNIKWDTYILGECVTSSYKLTMFTQEFNILSGSKKIHELEDRSKIRRLNDSDIYLTTNSIKHMSYPSIDVLINKSLLSYSKIHAEQLYKQDNNISNISIFFRFMFEANKHFWYRIIFEGQFRSLMKFFNAFASVSVIYYKYLYYLEIKSQVQNGMKVKK